MYAFHHAFWEFWVRFTGSMHRVPTRWRICGGERATASRGLAGCGLARDVGVMWGGWRQVIDLSRNDIGDRGITALSKVSCRATSCLASTA